MTTPPDHDELRIRGQLRAHIDGAPVPPPRRPRDWLDDLMDEQPTPPAPRPAADPDADKPAGEQRWDWRRLLHWPLAGPIWATCTALIPWYHGQSAALAWGHVLTQARAEAGVGAAYVIAAVGMGVAILATRRLRLFGWPLLICAFVGTVAMASPMDVVTFTTGVTR